MSNHENFYMSDNQFDNNRYPLPSGETQIEGGSQMVIRDLSGNYYERVNLTIQPGSTTVIIGDNVKARKELISDLAHPRENSSQSIFLPKNTKVEFVSPSITEIADGEITIKDFFYSARGIAQIEEKLSSLWGEATDPKKLAEAGELQVQFEEAGGWNAENEIQQILEGLRLAQNPSDVIGLHTRLKDMSSGQISKAIIGKALFSRAGIIIMDDPSAHLDVNSKRWLSSYIRSSQQATIIATSDMNFASEIGDRVVEILDNKLVLNIGTNVNNYGSERERLLNFWEEEATRKKQTIEDLRVHIRDFLAPAARRTDNMAQVLRANVTKLERMESEFEIMPGKVLIDGRKKKHTIRRFHEAERSGEVVYTLNNVNIMYEVPGENDSSIISIPNLMIHRKDRLAVVGPNGSGKSTLLKVLSGNTENLVIEGDVKKGPSVKSGYYSPYTELPNAEIPLRQTLEQYTREPMNILSYWGFDRSEHYNTRPSDLTYNDEIARAQFALIMAMKPNVILLDEPTSYLSPSYQEKLLQAIKDYEGTVLLASHDPKFLSQANLKGKVSMPGSIRQDTF